MPEATFDGKIEAVKWGKYEPDNAPACPIMNIIVAVQRPNGVKKFHPSLFMSPELKTNGKDAGKSGVVVALEMLQSYGVAVNIDNPAANDPSGWADQLVGQDATIYVKSDEDGQNMKCYLNRRGKPEIPVDEVKSLWGAVTSGSGSAAAPASEPVDTGFVPETGSADDLPF